MADFVEKANVKRAVRNLATQIPDVATLNTLVQNIIDTNPFNCVSYQVGGTTVPGVTRGSESYTARVIFEDSNAKTIGSASAKAKTVAGLNAAVAAILADTALATAIGGSPLRDIEGEAYSATVKCHDANGEDYTVTISRKTVTISSYEDNAIVTRVEAWADTKPALA